MKIAKFAYDNAEKQLRDKPILPLIDDEDGVEIDDSRSTTFKLRTVPAEANSAKYAYKVPIIDGSATPRQVIKWAQRVNKVFVGLAMDDHANRYNLITELTSGTAKSAFTTNADANKLERWTTLRQTAYDGVVPAGAPETPEQLVARREAAWNAVADPGYNAEDVTKCTTLKARQRSFECFEFERM